MKKTILFSLLFAFSLSIIPGTVKACDKKIKNAKMAQNDKRKKK